MPQGGAAVNTLIVGAGPAGLATAAELTRLGIGYRLLERGESLGHTWENLYDSLTLHTGRHMSTLPGLAYPRGTPMFPTRAVFLEYLRRYARRFRISAETGCDVIGARRGNERWSLQLACGEDVEGENLVMATGIVANPKVPQLEGSELYTGEIMHSARYRRPGPFIGRRVLVVGAGNSAGEIASELGRAGAIVTLAVRSGAHVVPRQIGPLPAQYIRYAVGRLPGVLEGRVLKVIQAVVQRRSGPPVLPRPSTSPFDSIPIIGFHLVDAIREGLVKVRAAAPLRFTRTGVVFSDGPEEDFDAVILATGYAPALGALGGQVRLDEKGFAIRNGRTASADQPRLWFVGHNYDYSGGLTNIRRDSREVAAEVARG